MQCFDDDSANCDKTTGEVIERRKDSFVLAVGRNQKRHDRTGIQQSELHASWSLVTRANFVGKCIAGQRSSARLSLSDMLDEAPQIPRQVRARSFLELRPSLRWKRNPGRNGTYLRRWLELGTRN